MEHIIYDYNYGDTFVVSASLTIFFIKNNEYKLIFTQESFNEVYFEDLTSTYTIVSKTINDIITHNDFIERTIVMYINTKNNPPPEKLFKFI